jgi:hypothetical protein
VKKSVLPLIAVSSLFILMGVLTSGCFHTGASRDVFFPREDNTIVFRRGTIAEVRHNFTGAFTDSAISVGAEEKQRKIDNFFIGKGGGDLYIWVQVHFGADTSGVVDFERYVHVFLIYEPGEKDQELVSERRYDPVGAGRYDRAELMDTINNTRPGLYSLRVEAVGTAVNDQDVSFYDWYHISVNGIFDNSSYNNNAPMRI